MTNLTPNGLSITQLKKDAKRLKKETGISLSEAQKHIAKERTGFSSWSSLIEVCHRLEGSIQRFNLTHIGSKTPSSFATFKRKPVVLAVGEIGTGKTILTHRLLATSNLSGKKILICDFRSCQKRYWEPHHYDNLNDKPNDDVHVHAYEDFENGRCWSVFDSSGYLVELHKLLLSGDYSILLIDEMTRLDKEENLPLFEAILDTCASKGISTIIATQLLNDKSGTLLTEYLSVEFIHDRTIPVSLATGSYFKYRNHVSGDQQQLKLTS